MAIGYGERPDIFDEASEIPAAPHSIFGGIPMNEAHSPQPGERWLVNLQAIEDAAGGQPNQVVAVLGDFDARNDTWTVRPDGAEQSVALLGKYLIRRLD